MGNWWIILLLLCSCNNNGGGRNRCGCFIDNGCECNLNPRRECNRPDYDCQDSLIQPRGIFMGSGTCGCESKSE